VTDTGIEIPAPVAGEIPAAAITNSTSQYTATVLWNPTDDPFLASALYDVTITLTPNLGYTLTGITANSFTVNGVTATNLANDGVVTFIFPVTETTISADISLTAPVHGETPQANVSDSEFTGTVEWNSSNAAWVPSDGFVYGETYEAVISLTPEPTYTLFGVVANSLTVNGVTATNAVNSGEVSYTFAATETTISISGISLVAPVHGDNPEPTITATTQYTGTVDWTSSNAAWVPSDGFVYGETYEAVITLTPLATYTLFGVATDFFTVNGVMATNAENSGVVSYTFTSVTEAVVTDTGIEIPAPVAGETPAAAITNFTSQYTVSVEWNDALDPSWDYTSDTFAPGTVYDVTITLTPVTGYTLTGVGSFTVNSDAAASFNAGTSEVTYTFPATAP
jgi:hypothetical protein